MSDIVILICLYLSSLISYRNVFVLQTELCIPPFKRIMFQPSSMFVAREMKRTSHYKTQDCPKFNVFEIWYPLLICAYLSFLISYRNVFVLQTELWIPLFKWNMSQPSSMFVAREIRKTSNFKTHVCPVFKSSEIWYPILICWYLSFLISYRIFFVLQTELWIPLFKWNMSQPSSMFVAREIKPTLWRNFLLSTCCNFLKSSKCPYKTVQKINKTKTIWKKTPHPTTLQCMGSS